MRAAIALCLVTGSLLSAQPPGQNYDQPAPNKPDAATLKVIAAKTAELEKAMKEIRSKAAYDQTCQSYLHDVDIYLKAAVWIVRHNEWFTKDSGKQTITVLDAGLARAKHLLAGETPWLDIRGKQVVRGYWSPIDGSTQPYSVAYPPGFGKDGQNYLGEIVLHGRDASLTEVKFLAGKEGARENPKLDKIVVEIYGRGNNAYRWAGEADVMRVRHLVFETVSVPPSKPKHIDERVPVIRGFSMGGAGTWHLGLQHPFAFSAMAPGAGFTVTHGYIQKLANPQPDYIERCLHIYDAADYAENLANIPCVAYSGEIDPQMAAVKNVETKLKGFPEKLRFTHIVGTGLAHKLPPEWLTKVNAQLDAYRPVDAKLPGHVHFVTYTLAYSKFAHGQITGLERHYDKAVVDLDTDDATMTVKTKNVSRIDLDAMRSAGPAKPLGPPPAMIAKKLTIDGQNLTNMGNSFKKTNGKWVQDISATIGEFEPNVKYHKSPGNQGPIDDAFNDSFAVIVPTKPSWNEGVNAATSARLKDFDHLWNKWFRGHLPKIATGSIVYFGDPASNPDLASILGYLPINWTKDTLEMNGKKYDAKTHFPVMIYPKPMLGGLRAYYVLNSGHTFGEDALKGTNALLYPRLGDWAVLKLAPTKENPHATEVVDAGIFDEYWQFEKKAK